MTLKSKNRYTLALSFLFLGISALVVVFFLLKLNSPSIKALLPVANISFDGFSPFKQSDFSVFFAEFCLLVYIPTAAFYIYMHFIKTPAGEVIYFLMFLLGCTFELLRVFVPIEIIESTTPKALVLIGRGLFFGRALCFTGLFTAVVAGTPEHRLNAEQYIFVIIVSLLILTNMIAVNTMEISETYSVSVGMKSYAISFYTVLIALTFASYMVSAWKNENKIYIYLGLYTLCLEAGLIILTASAVFVFTIIGMLLLYIGTFLYLNNLHKLYV